MGPEAAVAPLTEHPKVPAPQPSATPVATKPIPGARPPPPLLGAIGEPTGPPAPSQPHRLLLTMKGATQPRGANVQSAGRGTSAPTHVYFRQGVGVLPKAFRCAPSGGAGLRREERLQSGAVPAGSTAGNGAG